jgi:hypothetical protein
MAIRQKLVTYLSISIELKSKSQMSDFTEAIFGKEYADASDKFDAEMRALDKKYPNILDKDDSFMNYFVMTNNVLPNKVTFKIIKGKSDIPNAIVAEMEKIFEKHFKPKS